MKYRIAAYLMSMFFVSSCSHYGAAQLPPDRISYNNSLQYSDNQQMILNIVRLRYTDSPYFLSVNNIVGQFSFDRSLSVSLANNSVSPPAILATGDGTVSTSESPTITYTPLQGADYVTKLLTPVDLSVVYMLLRAGWGVNEIFRLLVQRLGHLDNATLASRTTSSRVPQFKEFQALGLFIRQLQKDDNLTVLSDKFNNGFAIRLKIPHFNQLKPRQKMFLAKHGVTQVTPYFVIVGNPMVGPHKKNYIFAQTRTVLGVFNYLSKGVDVPKDDVKRKLAPQTYTKTGELFDWHQVTIGQMRIHSSLIQPANGHIYARYRGYWFYIADEDFDSKETLNILAIIMGIYQGEIKSVLPVFTVS